MAEIIPEKTEEKVPKKARELFDKGLVAMERKNFSYAMDMFSAALDIEPKYIQARRFLRAASINQFVGTHPGDASRSIAHATSLLSGVADLISANMAIKQRPIHALRLAEKLLRRDPLNLVFVKLFCKAAQAAGLSEAAINTLEAVREYYPDNTGLLLMLGSMYKAANRLSDARAALEAVHEMRPNDQAAAKALKDVLALESMSRGGWSEAGGKKGGFRAAIRDALEAAVLEQGAKVVKSEGSLDMLIADAQAKVNREPENMNHRRALSNLFLQANRFDDAIYALRDALRFVPALDPQMERQISEIRMKQFDHEITMLRENGDTAGAAAKEAERAEFRFTDLKTQVERYPNDHQLRFEYGEILAERGLLDEAIAQFQAAQRNPHFRIRSLFALGVCFKSKGLMDIALEQFEKAASEISQMNEIKMDITYEMAEVLDALGRLDEAIAKLKEIYQVNIAYKDVAAKIQQAYQKKGAKS